MKLLKIALTPPLVAISASLFAVTLPDGYQKVAYLESTGTQYIDTDYKMLKNSRFVLDFAYTTTEEPGGSCGYDGSTYEPHVRIWREANAESGVVSYCAVADDQSADFDYVEVDGFDTRRHVIDLFASNRWRTFDAEPFGLHATEGVRSMTRDTKYSMFLFAVHPRGTTATDYMKARVYGCQMYEDVTLKRDFVPCVRLGDGKPGLYDTAGQKFYPNKQSTGDDFVFHRTGVIVSHTHANVFAADGFSPALGHVETSTGTFTAPAAEQTAAGGRVKYTVTGWKLVVNKPNGTQVETQGSGTSCAVEIGADDNAELEWQLAPQYLVTVTAGEGGTVSSAAQQWVAADGRLTAEASPDQSHGLFRWEGATDNNFLALNPVTVQVRHPLELVARFGRLIHVASAENGGRAAGDGSSDSPFLTLEAALEGADQEGDVIRIAGPFAESPAAEIVVEKGVVIESASGNPEDVRFTGPGPSGKTKYRVFTVNHAKAALRNLVIEKGNIDYPSYCTGGCVLIGANGGTVAGCVIRNGKNTGYATRNNGGGGGIACGGTCGQIVSCVITNNTDNQQGGGVYMTAGTIANSFIAGNGPTASSVKSVYGAGATLRGTSRMVNCTLTGNQGKAGSGGIDAYVVTAEVVDTLIWGNLAESIAGEVYSGEAGCFRNCLARFAINDSCLATGVLPSTGEFLTPTPASPALDASVGTSITLPAQDVLGNARVTLNAADIGAVEYQVSGPDASFMTDVSSGLVPMAVTFSAIAVGMDDITGYGWDFDGDGTVDETTPEPSVTHVYEAAGAFAPRLTVFYGTEQSFSYAAPAGTIVASPKRVYVANGNSGADYPYATPETAAGDIQTALDAAIDGQEIIVLRSDAPYSISASIEIVKGVTLHGETGDPEDVRIVRTGSAQIRIMRINNAGAFVHSLVLQGGFGQLTGVGLLVDTAGGMVSNCVIRGNTLDGHAAADALQLNGADAVATHCVISNNVNRSSGVMRALGVGVLGGSRFLNSLVCGNRDNSSDGDNVHGAVRVSDGSLVENCTVVDNSARQCAGISASAGTVRNCVIAGNRSTVSGAEYDSFEPGQEDNFTHCACDTAKINDTCVTDGAANFFNGYAHGDYTVGTGSLLIDAGEEPSWPCALDLAGFTRVMGEAIDIGCYEYDTSKLDLGVSCDVGKAIVPVTATFTAALSDGKTDGMIFEWDFDGDGTVDATTTEPTASFEYTAGGRYTLGLRAHAADGSRDIAKSFPDLLYLLNKNIFVVRGNAGEAFPYATFATAAKTLDVALAAAIDGNEIVLSNGTHDVTGQVLVDKNLTIRGYGPDPAQTVVLRTGGATDDPGFKAVTPGAFVHGLTFDGGSVNRPGWYFENGGMISNCVIRRMKNNGYWASRGAVTVANGAFVTHCVITNNQSTNDGDTSKALVNAWSGGRVENCLIAYNKDTNAQPILKGTGGAFVNCTVVGNMATGGDILLTSGEVGVTNCIFAANTKNGAPGQTFTFSSAVSTCCPCNLSDTEVDGWMYEPDAAKVFVDPSAGDWHPPLSSPARDHGVRRMPLPATDLDGAPRKVGCVDLGCYENSCGNGLMLILR